MKKKFLVVICCLFLCVTDVFAISKSEIENNLNLMKTKYPNGNTWCGTYYANDGTTGPWECFGFACEIFRGVFNCEMPRAYSEDMWHFANLNNVVCVGSIASPNETEVKKLLSEAMPGDIIQARGNVQHTMVVTNASDVGVNIFDANSDGNNTIRVDAYLSHGTVASKYYIGLSLYRYKDYPTSGHSCSYWYGTEQAHPHKTFKKCDGCGYVEYIGESATYWNGTEQAHPHKTFKRCNDCDYYEYTGESATYWNGTEEVHPHKNFKRCNNCDYYEYTGENGDYSTCNICYPAKISVEKTDDDQLTVNLSGLNQDGLLIIAKFEDNRYVGIEIAEVISEEFQKVIEFENNNVTLVKAFVWENMYGAQPLSEVVEYRF